MRIDDPTCAEPVEDDYQLLVDARTLLRGYFTMENPLGFDAHAQEMPVDFTLPNGVPVRGFIDPWISRRLVKCALSTTKQARSHYPVTPKTHSSRCASTRWSIGACSALCRRS